MFLPRPLEGIIVGFIIFLVCYPFFYKQNTFFKNLCIASLFIYVGSVISLTMIYAPPWNWNISDSFTKHALKAINLKPFRSSYDIFMTCRRIGNYHEFIRLVGGNTIMLMPLGILVPLINNKFKLFRITLLAIGVSLGIELLQLSSNILLGKILRTVEIDDFIQNTVGCIVAYLVFSLIRGIYQRIVKNRTPI